MAGGAGLTEDELELLDPTPSIHALFVHYRDLYFGGALGGVSVEWSSARMTSCGGTCQRVPGGAVIKLSRPLLSLRPTRDLKDVLLHEMVHAHMFVERVRDDDPSGGGHGSYFQRFIAGINAATVPDPQRPPGGYRVAVYHTMVAEVEHHQRHHWRCDRCGDEVKRAMNRPPQEADCRARAGPSCRDPKCRFHSHVRNCGGTFVKTQEPEGYGDKKKGKRKSTGSGTPSPAAKKRGKRAGRPITDFFKPGTGHKLGRGETDGNAASGSGGAHPAIAAVLDRPAGGGGSSTAPQGESPVEERRRLMLQAAVARMQGVGSPGGVGAPATGAADDEGGNAGGGGVAEEAEVIELLDEESEEEGGAAPQGQQSPPGVASDDEDFEVDELEWGGVDGASGSGHGAACVACPVCGKQWRPGELSSAQLNDHVDACLAGG